MRATSSQRRPNDSLIDREITFSIQQLITYSAFLITVGASIYTFFKAIPKIDDLDKTVNELKESNSRVEERVLALREFMYIEKTKYPADSILRTK